MKTSTCENSQPQKAQTGLLQSQQQLGDSITQNLTLPIFQQLKLAYDATTQQNNQSQFQASTENYLNSFNLFLLSNSMSSFQNDLILNHLQQHTLSNLNSSSSQSSTETNTSSQLGQTIQQQQGKTKDINESQIFNQVEQASNYFSKKQNNTNNFVLSDQKGLSVEQSDSSKIFNNISFDSESKDYAYQTSNCNNDGQQQQEDGNQVTRQQLLRGLMGLEQQLKKLQQQSQQRNSTNCGSSTTSNQRYEDEENLSPVSNQDQNKFAQFCNSNDADPTPVNRKRAGKLDTKYPQTQLFRQQSSNITQGGTFSSSDVLTPCKNVNIVNGGGSVYDSNANTKNLRNMSSLGNSMSNSLFNCQNQYVDINEFCLEDDEDNPRIETSTMSEAKSKDFNKIKEIIYFIVDNLDKNPEQLAAKRKFIQQDEHFSDNKAAFVIIFDQLVKKFKHLKKTKEEKTKFCMRKAFRYLFAQLKTNCNSKMNLKEANEICMKHYFSQHVNDSQFVLPFRRNSSIKTMNAAFLKKVFSSTKFVQDYRNFLNYFDRLAFDDNSKKVDQLAYYILPMLEDNKFEIEGLRRLPWTMNLLDSTRNLAFQLLEFEENPNTNSSNCQDFSQNQNFQQNDNIIENAQQINANIVFGNNGCCQNEDYLSNVDTLSIQTQNRKISESCINMELLSRKQSICSNDSQQNSLNHHDIEFKQDGCFSDQHMAYLKQINSALQQFQQNWKIQQNFIQNQANKQIKREVIILSPPLYDLNENPYKKQQVSH